MPLIFMLTATLFPLLPVNASPVNRPNILFIFTDDHAPHAVGAYGSRINKTPGLDRLAETRASKCDARSVTG